MPSLEEFHTIAGVNKLLVQDIEDQSLIYPCMGHGHVAAASHQTDTAAVLRYFRSSGAKADIAGRIQTLVLIDDGMVILSSVPESDSTTRFLRA